MRMPRILRTASVTTLATILACANESTAPDSPLGRYHLAYVDGASVPGTLKERYSQSWIVYSDGWLVLHADSTYEMQIDGHVFDGGDPVTIRHSGTFHWNRQTGDIDLRAPNGHSDYQGTATVDSVGVFCRFYYCAVPFPNDPPDLTFARR